MISLHHLFYTNMIYVIGLSYYPCSSVDTTHSDIIYPPQPNGPIDDDDI